MISEASAYYALQRQEKTKLFMQIHYYSMEILNRDCSCGFHKTLLLPATVSE